MSIQDVFQRITSALDRTGVPYMLSGSFASAYYGSPRSTQDIDIVIDASEEQLRSFLQQLPADEYYSDLNTALEARRHQSLFNVIDQATGWKIDFIIRKERPFSQEEFRRRKSVSLHGVDLVMVTAEDAIVSKLEWAKRAQSRRQIDDAAAILRAQGETIDRKYLQTWVKDLSLKVEWDKACEIGQNTG